MPLRLCFAGLRGTGCEASGLGSSEVIHLAVAPTVAWVFNLAKARARLTNPATSRSIKKKQIAPSKPSESPQAARYVWRVFQNYLNKLASEHTYKAKNIASNIRRVEWTFENEVVAKNLFLSSLRTSYQKMHPELLDPCLAGPRSSAVHLWGRLAKGVLRKICGNLQNFRLSAETVSWGFLDFWILIAFPPNLQ